jgi:FPC/CPF motif-containing protein YcgG
LSTYKKQFWSTLKELVELDRHPWPADIPTEIDSPLWEFSFAGEPIFVVCGTPAHVLRQSRRSSTFMMTFQPRWVFANILDSPAGERAFGKIRERLANFDLVPTSPALGKYGDADNREFAQYFLDDENGPASCPFRNFTSRKENAA